MEIGEEEEEAIDVPVPLHPAQVPVMPAEPAPEPAPEPVAPGLAAYVVVAQRDDSLWLPWPELSDEGRAVWEDAAQAAINAAASQPGGMDSLYRERAHLVAHLAAIYPSCIGPAPDADGWALVCVTTPEGQMTWHIGYRDLDLFGHVHVGVDEWDGHTTAEKYRRLDALTAAVSHQRGVPA